MAKFKARLQTPQEIEAEMKLNDEKEIQPYESIYDKQGEWKGSKYRVSFQDKEDTNGSK